MMELPNAEMELDLSFGPGAGDNSAIGATGINNNVGNSDNNLIFDVFRDIGSLEEELAFTSNIDDDNSIQTSADLMDAELINFANSQKQQQQQQQQQAQSQLPQLPQLSQQQPQSSQPSQHIAQNSSCNSPESFVFPQQEHNQARKLQDEDQALPPQLRQYHAQTHTRPQYQLPLQQNEQQLPQMQEESHRHRPRDLQQQPNIQPAFELQRQQSRLQPENIQQRIFQQQQQQHQIAYKTQSHPYSLGPQQQQQQLRQQQQYQDQWQSQQFSAQNLQNHHAHMMQQRKSQQFQTYQRPLPYKAQNLQQQQQQQQQRMQQLQQQFYMQGRRPPSTGGSMARNNVSPGSNRYEPQQQSQLGVPYPRQHIQQQQDQQQLQQQYLQQQAQERPSQLHTHPPQYAQLDQSPTVYQRPSSAGQFVWQQQQQNIAQTFSGNSRRADMSGQYSNAEDTTAPSQMRNMLIRQRLGPSDSTKLAVTSEPKAIKRANSLEIMSRPRSADVEKFKLHAIEMQLFDLILQINTDLIMQIHAIWDEPNRLQNTLFRDCASRLSANLPYLLALNGDRSQPDMLGLLFNGPAIQNCPAQLQKLSVKYFKFRQLLLVAKPFYEHAASVKSEQGQQGMNEPQPHIMRSTSANPFAASSKQALSSSVPQISPDYGSNANIFTQQSSFPMQEFVQAQQMPYRLSMERRQSSAMSLEQQVQGQAQQQSQFTNHPQYGRVSQPYNRVPGNQLPDVMPQ